MLGETAQPVRALPEDPSSVLGTHAKLVTVACDSSSKGSDSLCQVPEILAYMKHYTYRCIHK